MENKDYKQMLIKRSYKFSLEIMRFIDSLPAKNLSTQVLERQLLRSATSIGANIVEAQASSSKKDFTNFINYALKSANETKYWLGLFRDSGQFKTQEPKFLLKESIELSNM